MERQLSPESSAQPGKWLNERAPHLVAPMDALSPHDPCQEVVCKFSSQSGKTEVALNFLGYIIDRDPGPTLVIQPNTTPMGEAFSKDRIAPMIRDTPALKGKVADPKSRTSGNTQLHKTFPGGHLSIGGANSPAGLASRPIRYLIFDEIDRYEVTKEGNAISLATKRTRTFHNRKILKVSSPTLSGVGIDAEYESADQQYEWHLVCPDCERSQRPALRHFQWPKDQPKDAAYVCEHCGTAHPLDREARLKATGTWVQIKDEGWQKKGFWMSQWASPFATWAETIKEFVDAGKDPAKLRTVVNTAFAEVWEDDQGESADWESLYRRREHYTSPVPDGALVLVAGVDTQDDRLEAEIIGYGLGEESWGIDYIRLYGDPGQPQIWHSLTERLRRSYRRADGVDLDVRLICIDSGGHFTDEVYDWCAKVGRTWAIPVQGAAAFGKPITAFPRKPNRRGVYLTTVGTDTAKELIYGRYQVTELGPGYCHWPVSDAYDETWFRQATSERKVRKYRRGVPYFQWEARGRNEALDCRVYGLAAVRILQQHMGVTLVEAVKPKATPKRGHRSSWVGTRSRWL